MPLVKLGLKPGKTVKVRQRKYLVENVVDPVAPNDATLVRLACMEDDAQGETIEILWESEVDAEILEEANWEGLAAKGFDDPNRFAAYFHTLRWNCVTSSDPRLFQAPFRAGIKIEPYQLEPLRKALALPRVNLFIADDVGLGKTIEAGLIAQELLLRKNVQTIVFAVPPGVQIQWQEEMERRFGLVTPIMNREYVQAMRKERGYGINPWYTHSRFIISHRLLIDEGYTGQMRDWLGEFSPKSLLIFDEAHHAAPASGSRYAIDTKITRAVRDIAPRFEHRLFLSATPHNGFSNSFSALLEILDPNRFTRGVPIRAKADLGPIMVRRLKEDVREICGGFPKRNTVQVDLEDSPEAAKELQLAQLVSEYGDLVDEIYQEEPKRVKAGARLNWSNLQFRLFSCVDAFAHTLRNTLERRWAETGKPEEKPIPIKTVDLLSTGISSDDARAELSDEEIQTERDLQVEKLTDALPVSGKSELRSRQKTLLDKMANLAEEHRNCPDARIRWITDWVRKHQCAEAGDGRSTGEQSFGGKWTETRLIIFTEYDDTLNYLRDQLSRFIEGTEQANRRIETYRGATSQKKRRLIQKWFNGDPEKYPIRILLCNDAAREGLNLQNHCQHLRSTLEP